MNELKDKVVIITGVSSGIGKHIAKTFKELGAIVIGIDKDETLENYNYFYQGDITKKSVIEDFITQVLKKYTKIDYLINNAGLTKGGLLSCNYEDFMYVQNLSLGAIFWLTKLLMDNFNQNASIINIASTRAFQSQSDWESYAAAKGGIISLTLAMAVTLKGIARVNCISPGWIDTLNTDFTQEDITQHPANIVGKPEDITNMILFLCSSKSKFITGENINIDGGMSKLMIYHNDYNWEYKG